MRCPRCTRGKTRPGKVTVTLERDQTTIVFKNVPAAVCEECGEEYFDQDVTQSLLDAVDEAAKSGVELEVRDYSAPPAA
jgi:YgiT-type zinc finger domain-containing protein